MAPALRQSTDVVYRDLAGDAGGVLLHLDTAEYMRLNMVGSVAWHVIDGIRDESAVVEEVRSQLPEAPPQLEADVKAFLADLRDRGLIVEAP